MPNKTFSHQACPTDLAYSRCENRCGNNPFPKLDKSKRKSKEVNCKNDMVWYNDRLYTWPTAIALPFTDPDYEFNLNYSIL